MTGTTGRLRVTTDEFALSPPAKEIVTEHIILQNDDNHRYTPKYGESPDYTFTRAARISPQPLSSGVAQFFPE